MSDGKLAMVTTACHFGISASSDQVIIKASTLPGQVAALQYEVDGKLNPKRFFITGQGQHITIELKPGKHKIWIYKCTEAITGPLFIDGLEGDDIDFLSKKKLKKIEFIGNSISCAAASDNSDFPCNEKSYEYYHNGYMSYAAQISRELGVDYILNSISGAGIYRNWNSDGPTVPQLYDYTDLTTLNSDLWNHKSQTPPDVISIALGTNDFSLGDGKTERKPFDKSLFVHNYIQFIKKLKEIYPQSKIILTDSPMQDGDSKLLLNKCLAEVKRNIDSAYPFAFPVSLFSYPRKYNNGCTSHPSVLEHTMMFHDYLPAIKKLM
jgi:hypothetical protein